MRLIAPNGVEIDAEDAHARRLLDRGFATPAEPRRGKPRDRGKRPQAKRAG